MYETVIKQTFTAQTSPERTKKSGYWKQQHWKYQPEQLENIVAEEKKQKYAELPNNND